MLRSPTPTHGRTPCPLRTMFANLAATALLALAGGIYRVAAEAPLVPGYQYPPPPPDRGLGSGLAAPAAINSGIAAALPANALTGPGGQQQQGYLDPASYQPRYNDFQDGDVHKHVYVHVAPEEPAERQAPLVVNARRPKKHYKIVFIKTPTVAPPAAAYVNVPPPDQEKTLIYVLTKKPDLKQSLVLSTPAPTQPAKPEVFFIRYKTNEAQNQQPQIVYQQGGPAGQVLVDNTPGVVKPPPNTSYGVPLGVPLNSLPTASTPQHGTYNTI